jgi:hypothetical protein
MRKLGSQAPVAHTCIPSYSGGRDQEDQGTKSAQAHSSSRPYLKKTHHKKKVWRSGSRCRLCVQTSVLEKEKKNTGELATSGIFGKSLKLSDIRLF